MFTWLSQTTQDILNGANDVFRIVCDIHHMLEEDANIQDVLDVIDRFEKIEWTQEVWDYVCDMFPDLIDELNNIRIRFKKDT